MRISVVCITSRSGGGLTILQSLLEYANGTDSTINWQFILSDQEVDSSNGQVEIVRACRSYNGWRSRIKAELIIGRQAIKKFSPDIVLSLQNTDTLARGKFPLAVYVQQALPFQDSYRLSLFRKDERRLAWRQYLLRYPILSAVRRAKFSFVQTEWLATALRSAAPKSTVRCIGFDTSTQSGRVYPSVVQENQFFYPASASSYKNHALLHNAVQILRASETNSSIQVLLTIEQEAFQSLVGSNESQGFDFKGWMSREKVLETFSNSILVFPSLVESLGLPLYEARNAGVWIVAPELPYAREALNDYPFVAWFDPSDSNSLATAMDSAWSATRVERPRRAETAAGTNSWRQMLNALSS